MSAFAWRSPTDLLGQATTWLTAGDAIRTGENAHPHYEVIALSQDRAWIRCIQHGTDHIVSTARCRKI